MMSDIDSKGFLRQLTAVFCAVVFLAGCASQQSSGQSSATPVVEGDENALVESMPNSQPAADTNVVVTLPAQQGDMAMAMPEGGEQVATRVEQPEFDQADVIWIQQRLKDLGYYNGPVDGSVGQVTRGAIKEYQRDQAVTANGLPSSALREFMWRNGG
jgi:peptidoglycan hydrolase-like protein with peptidoglycan-binding domain